MHARKPDPPFSRPPALPAQDDTLRPAPRAPGPAPAAPHRPDTTTPPAMPVWPPCSEEDDTIAVPLALADTLPRPQPVAEDAPTVRTSPDELAALLRLMRPREMLPPRPAVMPVRVSGSAVRVPESGPTLRLLRQDAMMPTQLWFGPPARMPARPTRPAGFWARLWIRLGLATAAGPRRTPPPHRRRGEH